MTEKANSKYYYAKGRRKTSSATVRLFEGKGESSINEKEFTKLYPSLTDQKFINAPFTTIGKTGEFYFTAKVVGGGSKSQRGAIRHAIARALTLVDAEFRPLLKPKGYLTRDPRMVERKKTGLRKARKSEQYSKR